MVVLKSDDQFTITGRGQVFSFKPRIWPKINVGDQVMIDGALWTVSGLEMTRPMVEFFDEIPRPQGILVRTRNDVVL